MTNNVPVAWVVAFSGENGIAMRAFPDKNSGWRYVLREIIAEIEETYPKEEASRLAAPFKQLIDYPHTKEWQLEDAVINYINYYEPEWDVTVDPVEMPWLKGE
ncbi:hypothetical protein [Nitrolancea hollandica]|uniref:Uncharacterized protein n=1 Tax=Nitrolancea hollandica Lb TaxID=1129897 RepID=I4EL13_9BACT|nr:hypothetical protein [Nitrolancea hollandica]CCF85375.1 hypothetical protein NITHO_4890004 [Nitrolancea hollandica Lb]